jgi:hypothetical protein
MVMTKLSADVYRNISRTSIPRTPRELAPTFQWIDEFWNLALVGVLREISYAMERKTFAWCCV